MQRRCMLNDIVGNAVKACMLKGGICITVLETLSAQGKLVLRRLGDWCPTLAWIPSEMLIHHDFSKFLLSSNIF